VAFRERRLIRYADVFNDPEVPSGLREVAHRIGQNYSMALAPMLWEDRAIGSIFVGRTSMKAFSDKECGLLRSFADQAVIAIQNARLFNEVKQRTEDLSESLQQQTATADVLKVISRSAFDLQTVFETLVESAAQLCRADKAAILRLQDGRLKLAATHGFPAEFRDLMLARGLDLDRGSVVEGPRLNVARCRLPIFWLIRSSPFTRARSAEAFAPCWAFRCCAREIRSAPCF